MEVELELGKSTIDLGVAEKLTPEQVGNLTWAVESFEGRTLALKLEFSKPLLLAVD